MIDNSYWIRKTIFILACVIVGLVIVFIMATRPELVGASVLKIKIVFDAIIRAVK